MNSTYNILDFETTGFSTNFDRVIEVGVIKVRNDQIIDKFESLVNPGVRIPSAITNLTGISNHMLKDARSGAFVMPRLKAFVGDELIVAHNASFDARFFRAEMERYNLNASNSFLCSLLLARRIYQNLDSHKLGNLCRHIGVVNKASHRALGDAEVTFDVLHDICDKVKRNSGKDSLSYDYLAQLSKVPKKKVQEWLLNQL